jgi:hypothetical protein
MMPSAVRYKKDGYGWKMRLGPFFVAGLVLAALAGCARSPVERALAGEYPPERANRIITVYCTSCHSHKDFKAEPHLARVPNLYDKEPYRGATECRICHRVELKGWAIPWVKRKTHRPHGRMTPLARRRPPSLPPPSEK